MFPFKVKDYVTFLVRDGNEYVEFCVRILVQAKFLASWQQQQLGISNGTDIVVVVALFGYYWQDVENFHVGKLWSVTNGHISVCLNHLRRNLLYL
jgi:hypothetical protein